MLWRILAVGLGVTTLALAAAVGFGLPSIAATEPHWEVTEWLLGATMRNGVARRARGIVPPGDLDDAVRIRRGAIAYDAMCVACHAAPGVAAEALAEGLMPRPPDLSEEAAGWGSAELFWITRNGIRMTGMPAFGPTHSDEDLWDLVAFLRRLPETSDEEYAELVEEGRGSGRHVHGGAGSPRHHEGEMGEGHAD